MLDTRILPLATSTASAGAPTPTAPMVPLTRTTLLRSAPLATLVESTRLSVASTPSYARVATGSKWSSARVGGGFRWMDGRLIGNYGVDVVRAIRCIL